MKRSEPLRSDPEQVRAWQQRSRERARERARQARSGDDIGAPVKRDRWGHLPIRPKPKRPPGRVREGEDPQAAASFNAEACRLVNLTEDRCIVTGASPDDVHHVISKERLRGDGRGDLVWDPRGGVPVTRGAHDAHELASRRIRQDELPPHCIAFAREHGYGGYLDHYYPA